MGFEAERRPELICGESLGGAAGDEECAALLGSVGEVVEGGGTVAVAPKLLGDGDL